MYSAFRALTENDRQTEAAAELAPGAMNVAVAA